MSNKVKFNLDDLLNLKNFSQIQWNQLLADYQKKYSLSYIDLECSENIKRHLEKLDSFLQSAEHLNITCTFWVNHHEHILLIKNIPQFHRAGLRIQSFKALNSLFLHQDYTSIKDRLIFLLDQETWDDHKQSIQENISYIHIHQTIESLKNDSPLGIHSTVHNNQTKCNLAYQNRWPYETNIIITRHWKNFLTFCEKEKYIHIRRSTLPKERSFKKRLQLFLKFRKLHTERILRIFLFNLIGLKLFKLFNKKENLKNAVFFPRHKQKKDIVSVLNNTTILKNISSSDYTIETSFFDKMNGAIEWQSILPGLKKTSSMIKTMHPCLIKAQFSGIAKLIGFCVGDNQFIMVQANKQTHDVCLYIDKQGQYRILLDQELVSPVFSKSFYTPTRLSQFLPVRLACKSIFGSMITQQVRVWTGESNEINKQSIVYSIVVVCTRFSRRLEQLLKSICTQTYSLEKLQIIVCYVPGLDGTDDLIDSVQLAYPQVNITRLSFPASKQLHKGFMINQAIEQAYGDKVLLTDADIIFPPSLFKTLDHNYKNCGFVGAYARKMLTPSTTANILLGNIDLQKSYHDIINSDSGELRIDEAKGRPVGFFQLVKTEYIHANPYQDLPNFEGADAFFAEDITQNCEKPTIAKEITLLHMDHGGSQWYGTKRHM